MKTSILLLISLFSVLLFAEDAVSSHVKKVDAVASGQNLTAHPKNWRAQIDELGSKFTHGSSLITNGVVEAIFTMVKQPSPDQWPYVELMCGLGRPMGEQDTLTIVYKSDKNILIKLVQTDLGDEGNETYAYYEMELPATPKKYKSATVVVSDFTQPTWAPEEAMFVPLRPENVAEIQIAPVLDEKVGGTATVAIKKLVVIDGPKE